MTCGGFTCSRNALAALNVLYILVAFILIAVAAYGKAVAIITSLALLGGILACGVFLLLISVVGLIGAIRHHQVLLFFYMIILFLLFLIQFAVACACLGMNSNQQIQLAAAGWKAADNSTREQVQEFFKCCGFDEASHRSCAQFECCKQSTEAACCVEQATEASSTSTTPAARSGCPCDDCKDIISKHMNAALKVAGGVGLFFSFTEIMGVWLSLRYRNLKDPKANPSAFL